MWNEGTTGNSRILFSDTAGNDGIISYNHSARQLYLGAGGTGADITINSTGNAKFVGVVTATHYQTTAQPYGTRNLFRCGFSINEDIFITTSIVFFKLACNNPLYPSKSGERGRDFNEASTSSSMPNT